MAFLPLTQGRLVTSVNLRASGIRTNISSGSDLPVTTYDITGILDSKTSRYRRTGLNQAFIDVAIIGRLLEATGRLTVKQTRDATRIYSLGEFAFEPYQIVPGPVKTDLDLSRVVLYATDFFEALGFAQGSLTSQTIPFIIDVELRAPTGAFRTIRFHDCWLNNHTLPFDITGQEWLIVQSLSVTAGRVETSDATFGGVGLLAGGLASAIKLPSPGQSTIGFGPFTGNFPSF